MRARSMSAKTDWKSASAPAAVKLRAVSSFALKKSSMAARTDSDGASSTTRCTIASSFPSTSDVALFRLPSRRFGENGNYLFGRFSIADCMFASVAICFEAYGAELSADADSYMQTLLDNPFVQKWKTLGRREKENLAIAYADSA